MTSPFAITTTINKVQVKNAHSVEVPFIVASLWEGCQTGRARVVAGDQTAAGWFSIKGEAELEFDGKDSVLQYMVLASPTANAAPGSYPFRLDMVWVEDPEQNYVEGPSVDLEVIQEQKRKLPSWIWWAVGGAAGVIVLVIALVLILSRGRRVPDVTGLTEQQAIISLQEKGLRYGGRQPVNLCASEAGLLEAGVVTATNPEAGQKTRENVLLMVTSGSAPVPESLTGKPVNNVQTALQEAGFKVKQEEQDSTRPAGEVIGTTPSAGELLSCGGTVLVRYSNGGSVPPTAGLELDDAILLLQDNDLRYGGKQVVDICPDNLDQGAAGIVVASAPAAGEKRPDTGIILMVSSGSAPVPEGLLDQPLDSARAALEAAGFLVTEEVQRSKKPEGTVLDMVPAAGTTVLCGAPVAIHYSSGVGLFSINDELKEELTPAGGQGGTAFEFLCSKNYVVTGLAFAGNNSYVLNVIVHCALLNPDGSLSNNMLEKFEWPNRWFGSEKLYTCPTNTAFFAVEGRGDQFVNGIEKMFCTEITFTKQETVDVNVGFMDGSAFQQECKPGSLIVGVKGRMGHWMDQIGFICAAVEEK